MKHPSEKEQPQHTVSNGQLTREVRGVRQPSIANLAVILAHLPILRAKEASGVGYTNSTLDFNAE